MSCAVYKLTSGASVNLTAIGSADMGATLKGYEITNNAATTEYVKFYWGAPGNWSSGGNQPTVGTDVPSITVGVPAPATTVAPGRAYASYPDGIRGRGQLWIATTLTAADSGAGAVAAGDLIISIFYE